MRSDILWVVTSVLLLIGVVPSSSSSLRPESELQHSCYGFPGETFHLTNSVQHSHGKSPMTAGGMKIGDIMFDFTLQDLDGRSVSLSALLLAKKPVFIVWGMWTDPAFRGLQTRSAPKSSFQDEWNLVEIFQHSVVFVHLVGPEPYPVTPDTSFESGQQVIHAWSTVRQPITYDDRLTLTRRLREYVHPQVYLLPDTLSAVNSAKNQGVWCTLGLGARTALLVSADGLLVFKQDLFDADEAAKAIRSHHASRHRSQPG